MKTLSAFTLLYLSLLSLSAQVILNGGVENWSPIGYNVAPTNWTNFTSQGLGPDPIPFGFSAGDLPVPLEGSFALRVYSLTTGGEGFSQVINLSPGSTYTITAQVKKNLWNGSWTVDGLWEVYIDGAVVTTWPVANQNIWETRSVTFTAAVAATTIGFRGRSLGPGYASLAIDDIRFDTPLEHDEDLPADEQGQFAAPFKYRFPGNPALS